MDRCIFTVTFLESDWTKNQSDIWYSSFLFKYHTRFQVLEINMVSIILSIIIFLAKFFTVMVSHCLDLVRRLEFLARMKNVLTKARFDPRKLDPISNALATALLALLKFFHCFLIIILR